jgi:restriction system protein
MRRRKETGLDLVASLPWQLGLLLGAIAFGVIRWGLPWFLTTYGGTIGTALAAQLSGGLLNLFAVVVLVLCWVGAAASYVGGLRRRRLLDVQTSLDSLTALSWKEFELLVGEAFRRQGYSVTETGLGGADGGIDLVLRKEGRIEIVQCKQWKRRSVDVATVREMWGLASHHSADRVKIVCIGSFTRDAERFAAGKPIDLLSGQKLLDLVRAGQALAAPRLSDETSLGTEGVQTACTAPQEGGRVSEVPFSDDPSP